MHEDLLLRSQLSLQNPDRPDVEVTVRTILVLALCGAIAVTTAYYLDGRISIHLPNDTYLIIFFLLIILPILLDATVLTLGLPVLSSCMGILAYGLLAPTPPWLLVLVAGGTTLVLIAAVTYEYQFYANRLTVLPAAVRKALLEHEILPKGVKPGPVWPSLIEQTLICCSIPRGVSSTPLWAAIAAVTALGLACSHIPAFAEYAPEPEPMTFIFGEFWPYLKKNGMTLLARAALSLLYHLVPIALLAASQVFTLPTARRAYALKNQMPLSTVWQDLIDDIQAQSANARPARPNQPQRRPS